MPDIPVGEESDRLPGVAKGALLGWMFQLIDKAFGFAFVVCVPRLVGLSAYGLYNVSIALAFMLSVPASAGLTVGLLRLGSPLAEKREYGRLLGLANLALRHTLLLSALAALLLAVFSRPLALFFTHDAADWPAIALAALAVPALNATMILLKVPESLGVSRHTPFIKNFWESSLKIVGLLALASLGMGALAAPGAFLFSMAGCLAITLWLRQRLLRRLPAARPEPPPREEHRQLWSLSLPMIAPHIYSNFTIPIDTLLLGLFATKPQVGLFSLALRLLLMPDTVPRAFVTPLAPRLARMLECGRREECLDLYRRASRWMLALVLPAFAFLLLRPTLSLEALGAQFGEGAPFLLVLTLGPLLASLPGPADTLLAMDGDTRRLMQYSLAALALNIGLGLPLLVLMGPLGVALAFSVASAAYALLMGLRIRRLFGCFPLPPRMLRLFLCLVPGVLCLEGVSRLHLPLRPFPQAALHGFCFLAGYTGTLLLAGLDREDRLILTELRGRIRAQLGEVGRKEKQYL